MRPRDCCRLREPARSPQGVDFFFGNRAHAQKFVDFLQSVVPVRFRQDKQLVSHNTHSNTYNYKYTYSVEIVPVCRVRLGTLLEGPGAVGKPGAERRSAPQDDLICFPSKLATAMGSTSAVTLCARVTNVLSFIDPVSLRIFTLDVRPPATLPLPCQSVSARPGG